MQENTETQNTLLETLVKELKKVVPSEKQPYLTELAERVEVAYLQNLEIQFEKHERPVVESGNWLGWQPISQLQHIGDHCNVVLFHFPYQDTGNIYKSFDPEKHNQNYPLQFVCYNPQYGFEVLATRRATGTWYVGGHYHMDTQSVLHEIDVTKADKFTLFAGTSSRLTREGVLASNKRLRETVTEMKEVLEQKHIELDAFGSVWCTGNCVGGQFRSTEPQEITEAMLFKATQIVHRLIARGPNTGKLEEKLAWYRKAERKLKDRVRKHAIEAVVKRNQDSLTDYRISSHIIPDLQPITHCAPYIQYGTVDERSFSVNDALMYLLDKHVIDTRRDENGSVRLFLLATNMVGYHSDDVEICFNDIQAVYDASQTTYGLTIWLAEKTGKAPSFGTHYVGEMKELGLWKPEWDTNAV